MLKTNVGDRYEIEESAPGWAEAERQIQSSSKSGRGNTVVSVKSNKEKKRKAGESAAEIYNEEIGGEREGKKARKEGGKDKKGKKGRS